MDALALGPLLLPINRLPGLAALLVLLFSSELLDKRYPGLARWGWLTLLVAGLAGRLVHAASLPSAYLAQPWTLLYFWQPGYSTWGIVLGGLAFTLLHLWRHPALRRVAGSSFAGATATGLLVLLLLPGSVVARDPLPDLRAFDLDGQERRLSEFIGKPLVVNLWATWCPPCRREMPMLMDFEDDERVQILLLNQGESLLAVENYLLDAGLVFSAVLLDPEQNALNHYQAPGLPATLFYTADGLLVDRHFGELSRAQVEAFIRQQALDK